MEGKVDLQLNVVDENGCELTEEGPHLFQTTDKIRWKEVTQWVKDKLSLTHSLAFSYFDDEGDLIFGNTEQEWKEVLGYKTDKTDNKGGCGNTIPINILVLGKTELSNCRRDLKPPASCCSSGSESKPSCCEFLRPIPPNPDIATGPLEKKVNPLLSQYKYSGEALRAVALPLGPIGGGSIALAGDGGLRQWQVTNTVNHVAHVPDSFFAIRVDQGSTSKSVVLQSSSWYDNEGFTPAAYVTDHIVPDGSIQLLSELPGVKTLEVTAKYPIAEVDVLSDEVPVKVHLEAFNPCIPLDSKNSGIPVIMFNYTVTNSSSDVAKVSLLGTLQNIAGWDGMTPISSEVEYDGYGGNLNSFLQTSDLHGIDMSNPSLEEKSSGNGHVSISVLTNPGDKLSTMLQFDDVKEMWKYFTTTGLPGQGKSGPSPKGKTWNGAVCCEREVQPNTSQTFTFLLAWHFPHRYVNWSQASFGINDPNTKFYIGNQYSKFWKDIKEVLNYTVTNMDTLTVKTRAFRDAMFDSKLPWQMIDSAAGRVSVIRSPTCMWMGDGNLYGFEGCNKVGGCCPLNCTHVFNYEMAIAKCFPDLERTMRVVDMKEQISPNGIIPSRTTVPLELRRGWTFWPNYTDVSPASTTICVDGEIGTVLKTYREILHGASNDWFDGVWPAVKKIMARWMTELDKGDGLIHGPQPNTYDTTFYGVTTFTCTLYHCALRAAEEMAKLKGEKDLASEYADRFELGSANLDKACYTNGKWYTQVVDPDHPVAELADATFVDCLLGQWWASNLQLGYVLPKEHVASTLRNIFSRNHVDSFDPADQIPRKFFDQRDAGMYIGKWPGTPPKNPFRYSSEGAWTGLEYEFAQLCLNELMITTALNVLTDTREKYDGTRRSPWNEIECGDHYVRPMAAFSFFEIASGQTWRLRECGDTVISLGFAPRIKPSDFCGFFITATAWGQFKQKGDAEMRRGTAELCVHHGELRLSQLTLKSRASFAVARMGGGCNETLVTTIAQEGEKLIIKFNNCVSGIQIKAGESLLITLSG
ncbi:non-lysosomal glucosylceramidase-like [Oculina patagonica]